MSTPVTLEAFRVMFPRLAPDEARELFEEITAPSVVAALAEMRSRCACVGGSLYCVCGKSERPSAVELAAVEPLVRAFARGVETVPIGGD
jgi:hypothetical protein